MALNCEVVVLYVASASQVTDTREQLQKQSAVKTTLLPKDITESKVTL